MTGILSANEAKSAKTAIVQFQLAVRNNRDEQSSLIGSQRNATLGIHGKGGSPSLSHPTRIHALKASHDIPESRRRNDGAVATNGGTETRV